MPARWRLSQVLDMCAAPGSKTSQMLEVVNSGCGRSGQEPAGYVLANDSETSRAYMLVHQCKRISTAVRTFLVHACVWKRRDDSVAPHRATFLTSSRTQNRAAHARTHAQALCVTTHRAQGFPGRGFQGATGGVEVFDRVLCDVPCSGDGTVRKTFNIWRSWYPGNAMGLHCLQVRPCRDCV